MRHVRLRLNASVSDVKNQVFRDLYAFLLWLASNNKLSFVCSLRRIKEFNPPVDGVELSLPARGILFSSHGYYITSRISMSRTHVTGFSKLREVVKENNFYAFYSK